MDLVIIAAVARNGVIGKDGGIPWDEPADLRHFREETMGHPVIMGRATWDALPADHRPLEGRTNIVLSFEELDLPDAVENVHDLDAAVDAAEETGAEAAYVIGGASIYEQFLDRADAMVLTEIPEEPEGDTFFPEWDGDAWREDGRREIGDGIEVVTYRRA